ncbi:Gfo/Idh/MocA family oxidoreductase [Puia sp.]|uniref:Gfo/Idh/MocA family protein n=1 Tax=Puia sp. TaxID=2045100 RepID=UPI002F3F27F6
MTRQKTRRQFIRQLGGASLLLSSGNIPISAADRALHQEFLLDVTRPAGPADTVRVACIGMGIMGYNDVRTALKVPGVNLVAACDLYTGRLEHAKELFGKDLFTTRDHREILARKDIDAVIVATSDNWHARIATEALAKGKAVYCEKPMVHMIDEGLPLIAAQRASGKPMQIGSQRVSSVAYAKARELYLAGEIGKLNCIEASWSRQSALGAWEYTLPTDASPATVDWEQYIKGKPAQPYDAKKFFWWRNYRAFGTGMAGDLFVHLLSGIHFITGSKGPEKIVSSGQIAYWKDGRDVPDVMTALMSYPDSPEHPAFQVALQCNFVSGQGETGSLRFIGSEGVLEMTDNGFTIHHQKMSVAPGIGGWDSLETYPKAMQEQLMKQYNARYTPAQREGTARQPTVYKLPDNYDEHLDHLTHFFESVRNGKPVVEDPVFGFRACAPCLLANQSYFHGNAIRWDPAAMKIIS